jgi:hypothetical protein
MFKCCILFGLLFVGFLCVQPVKAEQGENSAQQSTPSTPSNIHQPSATVARSPVNDANVKQIEGPIQKPVSNYEQGKAVTRAECIQIGINAFIALVILWQALTYRKQRKIMERQLEIAGISERAYITLEEVAFVSMNVGERPRLHYTLFNGGRTPASEVHCGTEASLLPEPPTGIKPNLSKHPYGEQAFIPANTRKQIDLVFDIVMTAEKWRAIQSGALRFFSRGEVYYKDFQGNQQTLPFCVGYDPSLNRFKDYKAEKYSENPN